MYWLTISFGLLAMVVGADWLVRGCTDLARKLRMSEFLVSVIIIGIGTTAPEIIISIMSSINGYGELAVSNALASNTFRILGVLGMGAILHPIITSGEKRRMDLYFVLLAAVAMAWTIADGSISAFDGYVLLAIFVAYIIAYAIKRGHQHTEIKFENIDWIKTILYLFASFTLLYFGSRYFLSGLEVIAHKYNLTSRMLGIMIVAPGTSAPEIIITIIAALRKRASIILGNILGSNLVNISIAIAVSAMIAPLPVSARIISLDIWVMLGVTAFFCWQMLHFKRLSRLTGVLYIAALALYVYFA